MIVGYCVLCLVVSGCLWFDCGYVGVVIRLVGVLLSVFGFFVGWFWWIWFSLFGFLLCLGIV